MEISGFVGQVLFVVVLYKQRFIESKAFESLRPLAAKYPKDVNIFVYDNSPERDTDIQGVSSYVHDLENSGVSRAYNQASEYGRANGFRFMMLMDQDSFFPEHAFESYSLAVASHPDVHVFAPVVKDDTKTYSPFRFVWGRGISIPKINSGVHDLSTIKLVNSGLLMSRHVFEKCRGYDERFPLDFSDIVFCDRLAACNFKFCLIDDQIHHGHSSRAVTNSPGSKMRFGQYLNALSLYKRISNQKVSYWFGGFPTAAKLSAQHRDRWYIRKFFNLKA